ncbi:hypothetical protein BH11PSE8_BH11PSE8_35950 [soil metagenome]
MPIYAYRCETCGHAKDVLQKMSDAVLTVCPSCGAPTFKKQVTAAGFQLKGSGWYVTDFRGGDASKAPKAIEGVVAGADGKGDAPKSDSGKESGKESGKGSESSASDSGKSAGGKSESAPAPAAAPAPSSSPASGGSTPAAGK